MAETEQDAQVEQHEAFHLPPPSIWPAVVAVGIAVLLIGIVINLVIAIVGAIISVGAIALWVRDARHEFGELPD
ncbi:MAG TPA: cytochrome c oxidase subunit 4 [Candidatus Dormibacteraeota bacterium]|nr:cytochrome c oxidase subunit 4 [Candidatus Dormibacteraeota bacterium]